VLEYKRYYLNIDGEDCQVDIQGFMEQYDGLSDRTRSAYRNTLVMLERQISGGDPTDEEVRNFLRQFKKGTTLQRHKAAIRLYFFYKGNRPWPFQRREFISAERRLPHYLDRDQVLQLIENASDQDERMFVKMLFITGMRISELMSLARGNIEPGGIRLVGKGNKERVIPVLNKEFIRELNEYEAKRKGKLFPETYSHYWLMLRKLCLRAGVPMISPHTLRHSAAVDLINRGLPLGGVQRLLGHTQEATTLIYARLTETDLRRELERLEEKSE